VWWVAPKVGLRVVSIRAYAQGCFGIWFDLKLFAEDPNAGFWRTDKLGEAMSRSLSAMRQTAEAWMRQGISPRRLALTLALGFAIGCIPLVGIPTAVCAVVALTLRLNLPAIQAANYAAMPLQVLLIFPFVRLGGWMFASGSRHALTTSSVLHESPLKMLWTSGSLAGEAVAAWLVIAAPMVVVMTMALTALLRRVPALIAEAGD
jgi:uncharacterized protein (DUF2062 family)